MPDLLVRLYDLPPEEGALSAAVRRSFAAERNLVCDWVEQNFGPSWASECSGSFGGGRPTCFVAVEAETLQGFACYDTTARGMFGPIGVAEGSRQRGIGRALLLAALRDMKAAGYAYAVIGGAGSLAFYREAVGAIEIAGSDPGFYRGMLKSNPRR